jgi:hypothetical protein
MPNFEKSLCTKHASAINIRRMPSIRVVILFAIVNQFAGLDIPSSNSNFRETTSTGFEGRKIIADASEIFFVE